MKELFPLEDLSEEGDATSLGDSTEQKIPAENTESPPQSSWHYIKNELQGVLSDQEFSEFISPIDTRPCEKEEELVLIVPSMHFYQSIVDNFLEKIERCKNKLGFEHLSIVIDLDRDKALDEEGPNGQARALAHTAKGEDLNSLQTVHPDLLFSESLARKARLNQNYLFKNFVHGPSNQFAVAACKNVVENPGATYNPLFIYGCTGLGKTHLLHAVGNHLASIRPDVIIAYISSERFMNELIYCIRHNKISEFRNKYRSCDLFLMDDIQFISGNKAATQEEFFHTFNNLYEGKKQIIVTSDLFPREIPDIEERLRNRFQWGLIADIQPPDTEHRIAILFQKAKQLDIDLSSEVAEYIASRVKRNVRELEGALHRLNAFASLQGRRLNLDLARETFYAIASNEAPRSKNMLIDVIQREVADHFRIKLSDLRSKRRHKAFTVPRQIAMYLARKYSQESFPEIGESFGGRDHTTVIHATKKIGAIKKNDLDIMAHLDTLERSLERRC